MSILLNTDLPDLNLVARGKVRDIYDLGETLLIVTTDRISAFDVIMNEGVRGGPCRAIRQPLRPHQPYLCRPCARRTGISARSDS